LTRFFSLDTNASSLVANESHERLEWVLRGEWDGSGKSTGIVAFKRDNQLGRRKTVQRQLAESFRTLGPLLQGSSDFGQLRGAWRAGLFNADAGPDGGGDTTVAGRIATAADSGHGA
jgi:hypothetical protein